MKNITNNNTLLSQKEIDTLIRFLTSHDQPVQGTVLSQDSIDKLVSLLQNNGTSNVDLFCTGHPSDLSSITPENLSDYTLDFTIDEESSYISIIAENEESSINITPLALSILKITKDNSEWGFYIEPVIFDRIASIFSLKYTKATYDKICELFSLKHYGKPDAVIPHIYLPSANSISNNMIM